MTDQDNELPVQDELTSLKERATQLGVSFHPSIGLEKLREKVNAALNDTAETEEETSSDPVVVKPPVNEAPAEETDHQRRMRLKREAHKLVRIRLTCMNPMKKDWSGEIFTVSNSVVGSVKKFVPFEADEGWHVPHIIYEYLRDRKFQTFVTTKTKHGVSVRTGKLIKEFAIEVLPELTKEELHDLAQRQAMAKAID